MIGSSKHKGKDFDKSFQNFTGGYVQDQKATVIPVSQLSDISNIKYALSHDSGSPIVYLQVRQGTDLLSTGAALSGPVTACYYYKARSQYILATDSALYYLSSGTPVLIGAVEGRCKFTEYNLKLIIHDGGITKYWDGTNFGKLTCYFDNENIGSGDGSTAKFNGTLDHPAVKAGTVTIDYLITGAVGKTITDSSGTLTGDVAASTAVITGISRSNPCVVTCVSGATIGDIVNFSGIVGMTELNGKSYRVEWNAGPGFTFSTGGVLVDSSAFTPYVSGGTVNKNAIDYATGNFTFITPAAPNCPANSSTIHAAYEQTDGAPKSKAGLVRADQLYIWGDPDHPSRLWYTGVSDETDWWDSSVLPLGNYQYLGVETEDGYPLTGCANFFQRIICIKPNATFHVIDFPGDSTFACQPLMPNIGGSSYMTVVPIGDSVYCLGSEGLQKISAGEAFGDVQSSLVDTAFHNIAQELSNSSAYACYNAMDGQYWLALYDIASASYVSHVYALDTRLGLLTKYKFAFAHSSFEYVNDEMLIGGADGNLYRMVTDRSTYCDNSVSYSSDTYIQLAMTDWQLANNQKHLKNVNIRMAPSIGFSATLAFYLDNNFITPYGTVSLSSNVGDLDIWYDGAIDIGDLGSYDMGDADTATDFPYQFTYKQIMPRLYNISTLGGIDFFGIDLQQALIGG